jgi:hypothetical protein
MTTNTLAADITQRLIDSGVTIIELPGGTRQLLGKYGTILLTQDIASILPKHIEQLCGVSTLWANDSGTAVHRVPDTTQTTFDQSIAPNRPQALWYEP